MAVGGLAERREKIRGRAISPTSSRRAVEPSQDCGPEALRMVLAEGEDTRPRRRRGRAVVERACCGR